MVGKLFQHYLLNNLTIHHDLENYLYHINFFFFGHAVWLQDLSSPVKDGTQAACSGSTES